MAPQRHLSATRPLRALPHAVRPSATACLSAYATQPPDDGCPRAALLGTTPDRAGFRPKRRVGAAQRRRQRARATAVAQRATSLAVNKQRSPRRPRRTPETLPARASQLDALAARLAESKARVLTTQEAADMLHVCTKYLRESACVRYVLSPTKTLWLDVDLYAYLLTTRFAPAEHVPTAEGSA